MDVVDADTGLEEKEEETELERRTRILEVLRRINNRETHTIRQCIEMDLIIWNIQRINIIMHFEEGNLIEEEMVDKINNC